MISTNDVNGRVTRKEAGKPGSLRLVPSKGLFQLLVLAATLILLTSCGVFNLGKWKGIEKAAADEKYYLVKDIFLSPGSAYNRRDSYDHSMNESVNLYFIPSMETNTYTAESIWYDPNGEEFKTIRTTYDLQSETKKGDERPKSGSTRIHTVPTKELFERKPGLWKVALYLEKDLVRRLTFSLR